jgi:hypothetical protein
MLMKTFILTFFVALFIFIFSCKETTTNTNPPPPRVVLVAKSPDSAVVETGIDAEDPIDRLPDPDKNGILIEWHPLDHKNLRAYDVYRRAIDTTGNFLKVGEVIQPFGARDTVFLDLEVSLDTIYYYYVVARDEDGLEGDPSEIDHYTLVHKPTLNSPINGQSFNGTTGTFVWSFSGYGAQYFIFRLEKKGVDNAYSLHAVILNEVTDYGQQVWNLTEIGLNTLDPGQYRWRIDVRILRDDRKGSESGWEEFQVQ